MPGTLSYQCFLSSLFFLLTLLGVRGETVCDPALDCPNDLSPATQASSPLPSSFPLVAVGHYGALPLWFEANQGQAEPNVQFLARSPDFSVFLSGTESVITLRATGAEARNSTRVMRVALVGANLETTAAGLDPLPGRVNYLLGSDPARWISEIPTFSRVEFPEVYPGISVLYYGSNQQLEHDFVVEPGASPKNILLRFEGVDEMKLDGNGDLILVIGREQLRQHRPVAYQEIAGRRQSVAAEYVLGRDHTVAFHLGPFQAQYRLVIDPVLSYATYLGGKRGDIARVVRVDGSGNAYVAGETTSILTNLLATATNSYGSLGLTNNGFVAKINPAGNGLVYLTYLGGNADDAILGMALDGAGSVYLTGYTDSTNFPTVNAFQSSLHGTNDPRVKLFKQEAFVAKLNPAGNALVYSSYVGGSNTDVGTAIQVDGGGNAYVLGHTLSASGFPVTDGSTNHGGFDVFYGKINPAGNALVYLKSFGGATNDFGKDLVLSAGNAFWIVGNTFSTNFPVTPNALQSNYAGAGDIFVAKINGADGAVLYSSFLGGHGTEFVNRVASDSAGSVYLVGGRNSADFPQVGGGVNSGGFYQSANAGSLWNLTGDGLLHNEILSLAVDPISGSTLYAGTARGVFKSANGGSNWLNASRGLLNPTVNALITDPIVTGTLYAGTASGVYKSTNGAANWTLSSSNLGNFVIGALLALDSSNVYAGTAGGLYRTTNAGANWSSARLSGVVNTLARNPSGPGKSLYAGTTSGLFQSTNGLIDWRTRVTGLANRHVRALAVDPSNPLTIYAGTTNGLFRSINGGTNWVAASSGLGTSNVIVNALLIDPLATATVYAGTARGAFKTTDQGAHWTAFTNGLSSPQVLALALSPTDSNKVFAGTRGTNVFGSNDVFVVKLDATGTILEYSLAVGGKRDEQGTDIAVDSTGKAVIVGTSYSTNWAAILPPTIRQSTNAGGADAFVAQVRADGSGLNYLFFLGGKLNDFANGVAVDSAGDVYVVGTASSTNFVSALKSTNSVPALFANFSGNPSDGFLAKFSSPPVLTAQPIVDGLLLRWRSATPEYQLEGSETFEAPTWTPVASPGSKTETGWNEIRIPSSDPCRFFRLTR